MSQRVRVFNKRDERRDNIRMSSNLDIRNMPDNLVGNFSVFAALSAVKEEAEHPLYVRKADAKLQDTRMLSMYEDVVAAVVCSLEGAQQIAKATKKALRAKMLSNDKVRFKNEKREKRQRKWKAQYNAERKKLADARKSAAARKAAAAPPRRRRTWVQEDSDTMPVENSESSDKEDDVNKTMTLTSACARLASLVRPTAPVVLPWWVNVPPPGVPTHPVQPAAPVAAPLPLPWWVNVPPPAVAPAHTQAQPAATVVNLLSDSD